MVTINFKYEVGDKVSYCGDDCEIQSRSYMEVRNIKLVKYSLVEYDKDGEVKNYYPSVSERLVQPRRLRVVK